MEGRILDECTRIVRVRLFHNTTRVGARTGGGGGFAGAALVVFRDSNTDADADCDDYKDADHGANDLDQGQTEYTPKTGRNVRGTLSAGSGTSVGAAGGCRSCQRPGTGCFGRRTWCEGRRGYQQVKVVAEDLESGQMCSILEGPGKVEFEARKLE